MGSRKLPSFQMYPGDWLRDAVAGCSLAAQGLWLRCMFVAHDSERYGYLQLNRRPILPDHLAQRVGCTPAAFAALWQELLDAGVPEVTSDGIAFSRRMVRDQKARDQTRDRVAQHRKACNGAVTPKYEDEDEDEDEVSTSSDPPKRGRASQFDSFWQAYPKKRGKPNALKAWEKHGCESIASQVIAAVEAWRRSPDWTKDGGQYIPHPATWLNAQGWLDELPAGVGAKTLDPRALQAREWLRANPGELGGMLGELKRQTPGWANVPDAKFLERMPAPLVALVESRLNTATAGRKA